MDDIGKFVSLQRLSYGMSVIRHNAPGEKAISLGLKVLNRVRHHCGNVISSHPTLARARIKIGLNAFGKKFLQPTLLVRGERSVHALSGLDNVAALELPCLQDRFWQGVRQMESDGIDGTIARPMREVRTMANADAAHTHGAHCNTARVVGSEVLEGF